ncbi:MAG TPA: serine/threonine-protein kinase, partial [Gemmata sp.]|nr:serine/threonine-protein kinase [Gemmata sp.]
MLEDRLPPDLVRVVDQHLRECPDCLGRLDRLSRERERTDLPGLSRVESRPNDRTPNPDVPADETEVELPEGITIGTCEILREIGRGGMGVVYEARNRGSGVRVAVKVLAAPALVRKNAAARFATEARAMARLRHPGIVRVYDAGVWSSGRGMPPVPYTVLELINGPSLRTLLTDGPLPFTTAASIVEQIARAVHHAHENGVIHRDLKPANILMVKEEDVAPEDIDSEDSEEDRKASIGSSTYRPKVTDFGIAKLRDETSGLTGSRDLLGTPEYMPPELGEPGRQASVSMDVYALGVILFECLTGRVPFRGASPVQTLLIAQSREAEPPSRTQPDIPRALDAIVLKCLAKKPTRRYPSAARLADDLAAFRRGEIDPSPAVLRRRAAVGVLAVAALTGSLALVFATRGAISRLNSQSDAPPVAARVNAKGLVPSNHPRSTQTMEFREGVDGFEACEVLELRPSMGAPGTDVHNPS